MSDPVEPPPAAEEDASGGGKKKKKAGKKDKKKKEAFKSNLEVFDEVKLRYEAKTEKERADHFEAA